MFRKELHFILLFTVFCFSSTFDLKYGNSDLNYGYDVIQTSDGGFAVAGFTGSYEGGIEVGEGYLIKTDPQGLLEWYSVLQGSGIDYFRKLKETSDGGFIILGKNDFGLTDPIPRCKPWLIRYDKKGKLKWEKIYNDPGIEHHVNDLVIADDGGFLILGSRKTETGPYEAWLMKTDDQGNRLWEKTYNSSPADEGISIVRNPSDGYLLVCNMYRYSGGEYQNLVSDQIRGVYVDPDGNVTNDGIIAYSGDYKDCTSLITTSDGGYIVTGYVNRNITPPFPPDDTFNQGCYVLKFSPDLSTQWLKYLKTPIGNFDEIKGVTETNDGGLAVVCASNENPPRMILAKTDSNGNVLWHRYYGSSFGYDRYGNVLTLTDNSLVFCGTADYISNYPDVSSLLYLVKTDEDGYVIYPPDIASFESENNSVNINWGSVTNAKSYIIYGSDNPDFNFTPVDTTTVNTWNSAVPDSLNKKFYYIKASTENHNHTKRE